MMYDHASPGHLTPASRSKEATMDHLLTCPVCFEPFDSDLSLFGSDNERRDSHLPVLSHQCPHKICASCLNSWQHRAVSKRVKQLPKWFKCPCCAKRTAFDAEEMEIDTFACTMFAHVKANGAPIEQSSEPSLETNIQSSESFLEEGSARRTEFYYLSHPAPVVDDADQTPFVQNRTLRSTSSGASRRKRDLMSAVSESKDTGEIRAMLDREDALTSAERFLHSGASRRTIRAWPDHQQHHRNAEVEGTREAVVWKCQGCGKMSSSQRKRCPPPCFKWRPGLRTGGKKCDESETEVQSITEDDGLIGVDYTDTIEADAVGDENFDGWECPSCKQISPHEKKLCNCKSTRQGRGCYDSCAIPGCPKYSQGTRYNHMCACHYSNSKVNDVATPPPNEDTRESRKKSREGVDDNSQEATHEDSFRWKCNSCKLISPFGAKACDCRAAKRRRLCAVPDCPKLSAGLPFHQYCVRHYRHRTPDMSGEAPSLNYRQRGHHERKNSYADLERQERAEVSSEEAPEWKCQGCGKTHSSERKRCPPPCRRWKDGRRTRDCQHYARKQTEAIEEQLSNNIDGDEVPGRRKNPYADRKRRDSPRQRTRYCCGSCDACMVDDCGECSHCLDMKKFGGPNKIRQKCMNLPPCYKVVTMSSNLDEDFAGAIERNVPSDEEEAVHKEDDDDVDRLFEVLAPGRYEYVPLSANGAKEVQNDDVIVTLFTTGWERGKVEDIDRASPSQKRVAKGFSIPRLVRYISDNSYWLHDLDDPTIYLSEEQFNNLNAGSTEASEGVKVGAWCVVRRTDSPRNPSSGVLV